MTVQSSPSRSAATGLPTMLERPTTTTLCPARAVPKVSCTRIRQPRGVHGTSSVGSSAPLRREQPADIDRMKAVDVLGDVDRLDHARGIDLRRQRQLHQDAVHGGIAVERIDPCQQLLPR